MLKFTIRFAIVLLLSLPGCAQTWFSNVTKGPTANSCTIRWTTAVPTVAHINYGTILGSYPQYTGNTTQYLASAAQTISGLTPGITYHFKIVASDATHAWATSPDYTCTTTTSTAQHSVQLNWLASNSTGVTGYKIYRSTISGGYYALMASSSSLTYKDTTVQSGATYYYVVAATNSAGQQSSYSNQVKAVVP